jgi:hypothetical protein
VLFEVSTVPVNNSRIGWLAACVTALAFVASTAQRVEAAACDGTPVALFFINGIWIAPEDAEQSRLLLKERVSDTLGCDLPVILAYNTAEGYSEDLEESFGQWLGSHNLPRIDSPLFWLMVGGARDLNSSDYISGVARLTQFFGEEIARNVESLKGNPTDAQEADIQTHLLQYATALNAGRRVIIVGHSQGNFFANVEFARMAHAEPTIGKYLDVIAVATPDNHVAGRPVPDRYTTLKGDFIHHVPGALSPTRETVDGCTNPTVPGSIQCHFFNVYMDSAETRATIIGHIRDAAGLFDGPPPPPLPSVAARDEYSMIAGGKLVVRGPGVLANDAVAIATNPQVQFFGGPDSTPPPPAGLGSFVNLNDGGFVWDLTTLPNVTGEFRFAYVIHSATGDSNLGTVTVTIKPRPTGFASIHSDPDPTVYYGRTLVSPEGDIYAPRTVSKAGCGFGICEIALQKIGANGPGWLTPFLSADALAPLGLAFGPGARVYFQGARSTLFAFASDGATAAGWPVSITDSFNPSFRTMFVDADTQQVHLSAASAFVADPIINVSLRADGSEAWRLAPGESGTMLQGPGRDLYVLTSRLKRINRINGQVQCASVPDTFDTVPASAYALGTPLGIFGSYFNDIYVLTENCQKATFYTWPGASFAPIGFVEAADSLPNSPLLLGLGQGGTLVSPTPPVLAGVSFSAGLQWTVPDIEPGSPSISAIRDGVLYVVGWDRTDGLKRKLFFVDAGSGVIQARLDLSAVCQFACNVTASEAGVYVADGSAIHKVTYSGLP